MGSQPQKNLAENCSQACFLDKPFPQRGKRPLKWHKIFLRVYLQANKTSSLPLKSAEEPVAFT